MTVEIDVLDDGDDEEWNRHVERSADANPFHRAEALAVEAEYSGTTCHRLVGYKGQEPVGIFPVFERSKGPITAAFSPPPPLWIHRLGPALLNVEKLSQRKAERRIRRFVEGTIEWLDEECSPNILRVKTECSFADLRPFKWADADVTPEFTYVVDLPGDREDLLSSFSSDARSNVRNLDTDAAFEEGDADDVERIVDHVRDRFDAQGEPFSLPRGFARDCYEALPDGAMRTYVCRREGEFVGGILTYETDEWIHRWQGGVTPDVDFPVNDTLDWTVMTDAMDRGLDAYDLVGAGDPRINSYKAKFGPSVETFHSVERSSLPMDALLALYSRVK
ncbi:lipid II:glycine glycyltransferase FemX [Halosimplex aquaticum]|uniref:Lipid II:glycine glycyltransferase FemX n=1 Tax=Halosimplex aquaticum TaxID=3026162 RepID=A0ABD5Y5M6_9EURY|nr:GNAT family N-acetyltransferase [Halosimplex aquaticum]